MQIFISYASKKQKEAERVCAYLEAQGKQCWIAPRDVAPGSNYGEEIIKGIESSDGFVLLFDEAANESQHVLREVERAVSKKLPMVVYRLDNTVPSKAMEYFLLTNQWLDATGDAEKSMEQLNLAFERQSGETSALIVRENGFSADSGARSGKAKAPASMGIKMLLGAVAVVLVMAVLGMVQKNREEKRNMSPTPAVSGGEEGTNGASSGDETGKKVFQNGDYVTFGSYVPGGVTAESGEGAIEWQVVEAENGDALLVATRILAIRPFDCAESGTFDRDRNGEMYDRNKKDLYTGLQMEEFRGSNRWESSDLRAWLNASGVVTYPGAVPQNGATDERGNAYGAEAGFLTDFSKAETALIKDSVDGVFLLTKEQAERYATEGTLRLETTPTEAAIAADETNWYKNYKDAGAADYIWATATAVEGSVCDIYYVDISLAAEDFNTKYAAAAGFGVRPAIRISAGSLNWEGDGSRQAPYRLAE